MKFRLQNLLAVLACWTVVFAGALIAQDMEGPIISTKFRCLSWEAPIREAFYIQTEDGMQPVRIHNLRRSEEVSYVGPDPVVFYRKVDGAEGANYVPVVQVSLGGELRQPLLFFVRSGDGFRIIPMEDSFEVYPTGSYRFYNFTDQKLLTKFGEERMTLEPKKTTVLAEPFSEDTQYPIMVVVRESEEIKPLYSNVWRHNDNFRYMILISKSGSKDLGPVEFRILSDFQESETESGG